ncbi:metallophosphoesterase family protein [Spirosoma pollinicola]|uniref:Metallophosphoesterase n=1 Tax=Spirosoma pollinicola TaxID=2057025 RepID=A0A2K8Z8E3_9BACT|nr:metallophosphoesterase [Spirosoma pollinicola]AUD06128.1 metallophosphoesterase [Spirosoma pollinicola]
MTYRKQSEITKSPERTGRDYLDSSRWEVYNHYKTELTKTKEPNKPGHFITDFLAKSFWPWLIHYVKSRFGRKYPYPSYPPGETGIYNVVPKQSVSIAITSDWATDTPDSFAIARKMREHDPDYTIHVGDTYYVGAPSEIRSNFTVDGAPWVRGNAGSFAVLGNHEMYARGTAFFTSLLPTLGVRDANGIYLGQYAGYFCLQNENWRILGLDTGYHSSGTPIVEFIPGFGPDCRLDQSQLDWLTNVVRLDDPSDKRGLMILTHHQPITAFAKETEYPRPHQQLTSILGSEKSVIWLWGHEHKLAFYEKLQLDKGLTIHGRCIGNGGTPVDTSDYGKNFKLGPQKKGFPYLIAADRRTQKTLENTPLGFNAYAVVDLNGADLSIGYCDNISPIVTELWRVDPQTGTISGTIKGQPANNLTFYNQKTWDDIVS